MSDEQQQSGTRKPDSGPHEKRDYRDTVFLPKTDFPMKAGLPQKEPRILADWQQQGLYERTREARDCYRQAKRQLDRQFAQVVDEARRGG